MPVLLGVFPLYARDPSIAVNDQSDVPSLEGRFVLGKI